VRGDKRRIAIAFGGLLLVAFPGFFLLKSTASAGFHSLWRLASGSLSRLLLKSTAFAGFHSLSRLASRSLSRLLLKSTASCAWQQQEKLA